MIKMKLKTKFFRVSNDVLMAKANKNSSDFLLLISSA